MLRWEHLPTVGGVIFLLWHAGCIKWGEEAEHTFVTFCFLILDAKSPIASSSLASPAMMEHMLNHEPKSTLSPLSLSEHFPQQQKSKHEKEKLLFSS